MNGLKTKLRGSFSLVGNTLYAANDGNTFDRDGVIALCIANISSKSDEVIDSHSNVGDKDWVSELCKSQLKQYVEYPNNLIRDQKEEIRTSGDYSGRWLLELLQNMDDAMGPKDRSKYIGTKGLGFLSVMQIGENPEIHSGNFNFCFSQRRTKEALISGGMPEDRAKNAPRFQVPWPAKPDATTAEFLKSGFKTVIKLEIRDDSLDDVKEQLQSIEHQFLLFSQNIDELHISFDSQKIKFRRSAKLLSGDHSQSKSQIDIVIERTDQKKKTESWAKWQRNWESAAQTQKRSSCMFCLQRKGDTCVPTPRHTKVHNFYPTEQSSELRGYLHLSFELTSDRKALQMWGDKKDASWKSKSCDPENKRLVAQAKALIIEDVIDDPEVPIGTILKTFSSLNKHSAQDVKKGEPLKRVQAEVIDAIKKHPFVPRFGGGWANLNSIVLWDHDFIDGLEEVEDIQSYQFAAMELVPLFGEMRKYEASELTVGDMFTCFSEESIKNHNVTQRSKLVSVIAKYASGETTYTDNYYARANFDKIKFLSDANNNKVCFRDKIFVDEKLTLPSFMSAPQLSSASAKDVKKLLKHDDLIVDVKDVVAKRFISDPIIFFEVKFAEFLNRIKEETWQQYGFEILAFTYDFYERKTDKFLEIIERGNFPVLVPSSTDSRWLLAERIYFSASWTGTPNLTKWLEITLDGPAHEHQLIGIDGFRKRFLKKFRSQKGDKAESPRPVDLIKFLQILGVRNIPGYTPVAGWPDVRGIEPDYHKLVQQEFRWLQSDYQFKNLVTFFDGTNFEEGLVQARDLLVDAENFTGKYRRHGAPRNAYHHHQEFLNIGCYQLYNTPWLKLTPSPLNPSGKYSPKECFLSDTPDTVFPSISSRKLKSILGKDTDTFKKSFKLSEKFEPELETWGGWIRKLGEGYRRLLEDGQKADILNAQIYEFFQSFLVKEEHSVAYQDSTLVPSKSSDPDKIEFEFLPASSVFVNNTTIDDRELASVLSKTNVAIFALGLGEAKGQDLSKRLGLRNLTEKFDVKTQVEQINQPGRQNYHTWISFRWDIFQALDSEFERGKSARLLEELTDSLTVCDSLLLNLNNNETGASSDQIKITPKYFETPSSDGQSSKVYILDDENKRNLIEYLCIHFFKWRGRTELISVLMADPIDLPTIREKLTQNNLPAGLIDNFKALHKSQEEEARRAELEFQQEQNAKPIELKKKVREKVNRLKAARSNLREDISLASHGDKKASNDDGLIDTNKTTGGLPSINKGVSNEKRLKPEKVEQEPPQLRPRKSRSGFGTRVSGHLRARNDNEVVGRFYFDDDDNSKPENKRIGDKAEVLIKEFIEAELQPDNVELLGGNNTGFDIQYKLNGLDYFVEVKGLSGSWNESDVLLSSAQFEKAQEEGEKYSIFVVEFVDDNSQRAIWEIRNPAHYFKKMQIDHGWRNFALSHNELQPTVGRYLICEGEKFKIEKVDIRGLLARLYVENRKKPIVFKPNEMTIEKGDDE
ncbi:DUF3883 domain-containing protein [Alphaproteobacteria bacterium]|nr:DUF3883 domain-containing protein [Alphaproteobacteria bacterium]